MGKVLHRAGDSFIDQRQLRAIVKLMEDPDQAVQHSIRRQLQQWGVAVIPELRRIAHTATPEQRSWIENFIREYQVEALEQLQRSLVAAISEHQPLVLEEVFFQISRFGYPETDVAFWRQYLDRLAAQCTAQQAGGLEKYQCLHRLFFQQEGFRGAWEEEYYHPDSSYAHTVLQTRRGTPLSLSIVYLLFARRIGIDVVGINMPLHFVLYAPELDVFIDPFQQGKFLSYEECRSFIESNRLSFTPSMLQPAPPISIVLRMLRNLVYGYNRMNRMWESSILQQCIHTILETIEEHGER